MAITRTNLGTANSKSGSAQTLLALTITSAVSVDQLMVAFVTCLVPGSATTLSVTDSQGNVWTKRSDVENTGFVRAQIWTAVCTVAMTSGVDKINFNLSVGSTSVASAASKFTTGVAGWAWDVGAAIATTGNSASPDSGLAAATYGSDPAGGTLVLEHIGVNATSADTASAGSGYTSTGTNGTSGGGTTTNIRQITGWKSGASGTQYKADGTIQNAANWAAACIVMANLAATTRTVTTTAAVAVQDTHTGTATAVVAVQVRDRANTYLGGIAVQQQALVAAYMAAVAVQARQDAASLAGVAVRRTYGVTSDAGVGISVARVVTQDAGVAVRGTHEAETAAGIGIAGVREAAYQAGLAILRSLEAGTLAGVAIAIPGTTSTTVGVALAALGVSGFEAAVVVAALGNATYRCSVAIGDFPVRTHTIRVFDRMHTTRRARR